MLEAGCSKDTHCCSHSVGDNSVHDARFPGTSWHVAPEPKVDPTFILSSLC